MNTPAYKILHYAPVGSIIDFTSDPRGLNFRTGLVIKPYQQLNFNSGQIETAKYWADFNGTEYSDLLVQIDFEWVRKAIEGTEERLYNRRKTIRWAMLNDDPEAEPVFGYHTKIEDKYYDIRTAALADQRRRRNIVDQLISQVGLFGPILGNVQTMLRTFDNELNAYINTNDRELVAEINALTEEWLEVDVSPVLTHLPVGMTLRQAIIGSLNYVD